MPHGPMPQFLLGLTIDNKANLNQLLSNPAIKGMLPTLNALGYQLTRNNNTLFLHSQNHAPAVNAGRTFIPAAAGNLAMMRQDQGGFIQFDALATMMSQIDTTDLSLQQAAQILKKLDVLRFKATYGNQRQKMFVQLTFRDKSTNGIRQLIQFIMDFAEVADTASATGPIALVNLRSRTARNLSRKKIPS